jgi:hypothetical protein
MRRILLSLALFLFLTPALTHADPPVLAGCQMFPDDNPWNTDISGAPVHPDSAVYIANINANGGDFVHPDFGENPSYGIPWTSVLGTQPLVPISFYYPDDSDPGPYPIPSNAQVEGGGDRHVLIVEQTNCLLYEVYDAEYTGNDGTGWEAGSGAIFDLNSNDLRPEGWTSADAAGLPILPGLANCAEAESGTITHALRFTVSKTQRAFIYPATHFASSLTGAEYPPMGLRLRLKSGYNINNLDGQALAIAQALKTYGMILADNGSNWFISGETNPGCWDDDDLNRLKAIPGTAFEVIVSPPPPSEVDGDLLSNGGFEAGLPNGNRPSFWTATLKKDQRRCNQSIAISGVGTVDVADTGRCAFEFKGTGTGDSLKQVVKPGALPGGTSLQLWGMAAASGALPGSGKIKIKRIYNDNSRGSDIIDMPTGSTDYAPFNFTIVSGDAANLKKLKLKLIYNGASGKLWLDSLSIVAVSPVRTLPLPPA